MTKTATKTKTATEAEAAPVEKIIALKGFDSTLSCHGGGQPFQFEVGKTYTVSGRIKACQNGFHAVDPTNPLHVWDFYPLIGDDGKLSRYAEVELGGATDRETEEKGTKIAAAEITVKVELSLPDFIKRAITAIFDIAKAGAEEGVTAASGDYSVIAASGHSSQLAASGHSSKLAASGDYSKLAASGHSSQLAASGDYSKLAASGHSSKLAASGHSSKLAASGDYSKLAASGDYSVIAASGPGTRASGKDGTWISLAEFDRNGKCIGFATGCIGKDGLAADTLYRADGGKLVAA